MQYADMVAALRGLPLFSNLEPGKLKFLAFSSTFLTLEDGEALFFEGEPADSVYFIEDGKAGICIGPENDEIQIGVLEPHELVGEMAIFRNSPRSATIRAAGPLKVLKIDADVFLRLVTDNADAALAVMRILSDKLARLTERYEQLQAASSAIISADPADKTG